MRDNALFYYVPERDPGRRCRRSAEDAEKRACWPSAAEATCHAVMQALAGGAEAHGGQEADAADWIGSDWSHQGCRCFQGDLACASWPPRSLSLQKRLRL